MKVLFLRTVVSTNWVSKEGRAISEFKTAVDECIARFLALPATAVAASKRLLARAFDLPFDAFRREMEAGFRLCLDSAEHRAAMEEIRQRRKGPAR
jgi:enoyl-CoA hydratase/carnithine racemase